MINLDEPICSRFWLTFGLTQSQTAHSKPGKALYFPLRVKPWQARQVWTFCDKHKPKFIFQMFKARLQHCWVIEYFFRLENCCSWLFAEIFLELKTLYCFDILHICSLLCIMMFKKNARMGRLPILIINDDNLRKVSEHVIRSSPQCRLLWDCLGLWVNPLWIYCM